ncbi:MAG TPA: membrane protein insertase YidC [Elusimicrobiales bacterium]|nr:membrane protein insertase YidC [Elusimicrobiales bacterium]
MSKNLILAFVLSVVIYTFWSKFLQKKYPEHYQDKAQSVAVQKPGEQPQSEFAVKQVSGQVNSTEAFKDNSVVGKTIPFSLKNASVIFSTKGAGISSFNYKGPVEISELVFYSEPGFFSTMENVNFKLKKKSENFISFYAKPSRGISITKSYKWDREGGLNKLTISISNNTKKLIQFPAWNLNIGPGMGTVKSQKKENTKIWKSVFAIKNQGKKQPSLKNLRKDPAQQGWLWAGVQNRYFLACILGNKENNFDLEYKETKLDKKLHPPSAIFKQSETVIAPGKTKQFEIDFYFGAKDYRKLVALGHGLSRSIEFGFFSQLGKLAMKVLYFNYKLTKNYGWSIIILTVMIQILMLPLTYKSSKSMMIMKKLQPEIKKIQEKYKKEPKRLQQETMALYKKHGTNPFGGCLPMLVQIPIFFALFTALRNSWDIHGASWILWIGDLSAKDPYYVLPILMGAMMFFQQQMTMATTDKSQAAIFKWMPVVFTFIFLKFPSGLVLYWFTSNIISFLQQLYLRKTMPKNS